MCNKRAFCRCATGEGAFWGLGRGSGEVGAGIEGVWVWGLREKVRDF